MKIWQSERLKIIKELINTKNIVSIEDLHKILNVSRATVRRDLRELNKNGKLTRVHGGAVSNEFGSINEPPYIIRKDYFIQEKMRIADAASKHIQPGEKIILDSSTTVMGLTKNLGTISNLTVITNDLLIANKLAMINEINLLVVGGELRKQFYTLTGIFSHMILKEIRADKLFLGVDAVDLNAGFMNSNTELVQVQKLMIEASKELIVLCDHSKFLNISLFKICPLKKASRIITGNETDPEIVKRIQDQGINIEIV